ncbi:uncharacterized protein B0H94_11522 [Salsuginibacillus halophilus]|uniref:HD/PDEase domain-containing protein n=1 Tax=Salsuginibacillus halophilus TaxID=517424 RepID=A0A2P8H876_9BACI|nr:HD domain-containing protein [Salsuginibacillus halophilus]PSL42418.1 uncharacterized protein B0H94_11522 [Salsuginibacillus halophilus]
MHDINEAARNWVWQFFATDATGHDPYHTERVVTNAKPLAEAEGANIEIVELASWLHDLADDKFYDETSAGVKQVQSWLETNDLGQDDIDRIMGIINHVSFRGGFQEPMTTLEGKVVQDADRLDAIGALGIARTFMFGGAHGRPMHVPDAVVESPVSAEDYRNREVSVLQHFYDKLLHLKDQMNTTTGRRWAEARHDYMLQFLQRFEEEWDGRQ